VAIILVERVKPCYYKTQKFLMQTSFFQDSSVFRL